jgi:hypothetical protein
MRDDRRYAMHGPRARTWRLSSCLLVTAVVVTALRPPAARAQTPAAPGAAAGSYHEFPLAKSWLLLRESSPPSRRRVVFQARWTGRAPMQDPTSVGASLRIRGTGADDGDTGVVQLSRGIWRGLGRPAGAKGYHYRDRYQSSGGVAEVWLKQGKQGGSLRVTGGGSRWGYAISGPQRGVMLTVTIGDMRWCALFTTPFAHNGTGRVIARAAKAPASCPCESFPSTFDAIEGVVFAKRGCAQAACHGATRSGGLDLRPGGAYDRLVDVPSVAGGMDLVEPGKSEASFLWRKLAAATSGLANVPGSPMPAGGLPALPENELEALRLWIVSGAPRTGVVAKTERLLDSCLPPPTPIKIRRPDPPPPGAGVQFHAPPRGLPPQSESEVCYATYYDVSAQVPDSMKAPCPEFWGGPSRTCFFYNRLQVTQDANSHHASTQLYKGSYDIDSDVYTCTQGANAGKLCDPTQPAPCPGGSCLGSPAFGPFTCKGGAKAGLPCKPKGIGIPAPDGADCGPDSGCAGRVEPSVACNFFGPPDWGVDPTDSGTNNAPKIIVAQQPVLDVVDPPLAYRTLPVSGVMTFNSHAFNLTDQPATNELWLNLWFAGSADRVYPVVHLYDAKDIFVTNVPPFEKREYCRTHTLPQGTRLFQLSAHVHKHGVLFRTWGPGITDRCGAEPERPVKAPDCLPESGPPILTSTIYNDPTVHEYHPPLVLASPDESSRTFKFCGVFDNGYVHPDNVKRRSTSPVPPVAYVPGGPCTDDTVACLAGPKRGQLCHGDDRACDSSSKVQDGRCDACPLRGGATTEDEMFILIGDYYVVP